MRLLLQERSACSSRRASTLRLVTVLQVLRMVSKGLERVPIRTDIDGQRWQECVSQHEDREQSDREPLHEASLVLLSQRDNQ